MAFTIMELQEELEKLPEHRKIEDTDILINIIEDNNFLTSFRNVRNIDFKVNITERNAGKKIFQLVISIDRYPEADRKLFDEKMDRLGIIPMVRKTQERTVK